MAEKIKNQDNVKIKEKFVERYKSLLGEDYDKFIEYSLSYLRKSIRVNTLKASVSVVRKKLEGWVFEQIPWYKHGFWIKHKEGRRDIGNWIEHQLGYFYVQEAASMIPPIVLDPKPGELVLDLCAAPGSKSTQMAQQMENKGILVCNDLTTKRISPLSINLQRCGVTNAIVTIMHGRKFKGLPMEFDRILVDAPCSGTGAIRKSFKTLRIWNPHMVRRLAATQKQLMDSAFAVLKPGGTLVYSTCTLEPEENEGVVDYLIDKQDAKLEEIKLNIKRSNSITEFNGKKYNTGVKKCLRIWPQDNDTEGFFVANIKKS